MRSLLTLCALVAALLVPWTPGAPTWLADAASSSATPAPEPRSAGPVVRLNPALGILPLAAPEPVADDQPDSVLAGPADGFAVAEPTLDENLSSSQRVLCEDGVCRVVDEPDSAGTAPSGTAAVDVLMNKLRGLGAVQIRVECDDQAGESHATCMLPVHPESKVMRRFDAFAAQDSAALSTLIEHVNGWIARSRD